MKVILKHLEIENFKGVERLSLDFSEKKTLIKGQNAAGKTTIFDAFTWLLFNKNSSGEEKFNVRPLDEDGNRIDNVEIKVVATLDIDGKEVELSKVQKQKWVKKRGTDVAKLQGNENLYEVGGYPKSESDYKAYIASIMDENLFKMITSPYFFTFMKWQEQRNILMQFVTELSDLEMAQQNPKFAELLTDLENASSTDDIKKKYQKALSTYKDRQKELPARIDEISKMKVDTDVAELELAKNALTEKITEVSEKIKSGSKVIDELEQQKFELQFEINNCKRAANDVLVKQKREIENQRYEAENKFSDLHQKTSIAERGLSEKKETASKINAERKALGTTYHAKQEEEFHGVLGFDESKWIFDESSTICSLCGQTLPADKITALRSEFEAKKADAKARAEQKLAKEKEDFASEKKQELDRIIAAGNGKKSQVEALNAEIAELEKNLPALKQQEVEAMKIKNECDSKLAKLPTEPDYEKIPEFLVLWEKDIGLQHAIDSAKENGVDTSALESEKAGYETELETVKAEIAKSAKNVEIDERITELENEQREVGQKVADQEKMLYLLEEFIREKMNLISKSINSKFENVTFSLFENLINGGMREKCEVMYDGIPFSSLNAGHRIVAGLEIIKALQKLFDKECVVFIDNSESLNDFNIPKMDNQLVLLEVTEDAELKVEVK